MSNIIPFVFENHSVRVLADDNGEPLFVARDVAAALGKHDDFFAKEYLTCVEALFCYKFLEDFDAERSFCWTMEVSKIGYNQGDYALFAEAYGAASMYLAWASNTSEATVMEKFKRNIGSYINGATIVSGPKSLLHKPDAWVTLQSGEVCPVEGNYTVADRKALKQLLRYMHIFSRETGILVAQSLSVAIPDNVIFVEVKP